MTRKRLYTTKKSNFQIVRDNPSANYDEKFHSFLTYIWEYMPSGILDRFKLWITDALYDAGISISKGEIDRALSIAFRKFERAKSRRRKR